MQNKILDFSTKKRSSRSVVVITFALHAKGLRFEPGREHIFWHLYEKELLQKGIWFESGRELIQKTFGQHIFSFRETIVLLL